ncbi:MAG: PEGA domain-containing protein [Candidatus Methylomirabilia bacterium]
MKRPRMAMFALLVALLWVTGCATMEQGFVIIDATPLEAQIFVDGRLLGSTQEVVARAFPLLPGKHTVKIIAPGFRPYDAEFTIDSEVSTRLRVALQPE